MANNNLNEIKSRNIVLDSLNSTTINAGTSLNLNGSQLIVNGSLKRTYPNNVKFGNTSSFNNGNINISEAELLNGLVIIGNLSADFEPNANIGNITQANILLPSLSNLQFINVNESIDFSIINNWNVPLKLEDGHKSSLGYSTIGHENVYDGTSALFKIHRNNISNYNVYRLS
jgi:hypothetical protein